jgi:hypothetical protein
MPGPLVTHGLSQVTSRVPGLRRIPILKLLALAEIVLIVRDHLAKLSPHERRRIAELARRGRGRRSNLSEGEREELASLIAKAEPRLLLGEAVEKLSPVPLPRRLVRGPGR